MDAKAVIVEAIREATVASLSAEPDFETARQRMLAILLGVPPATHLPRMRELERRRGTDRRSSRLAARANRGGN